jgi:RNA polymerase sigma-70 factor (ECF subfamily)
MAVETLTITSARIVLDALEQAPLVSDSVERIGTLGRVEGQPCEADLALVRRCAAGQAEAVDELLAQFEPGLRRLVARLAEPGDVDDLVQDTLLALLERGRAYRGQASLSTWLASIALNRCRRLARRRRLWRMVWPSLRERRDKAGGGTARREGLETALARLSHGDREVLVLRYQQDMTAAEAAATLGIQPAAFDTRLSRARQRLKRLLETTAADSSTPP